MLVIKNGKLRTEEFEEEEEEGYKTYGMSNFLKSEVNRELKIREIKYFRQEVYCYLQNEFSVSNFLRLKDAINEMKYMDDLLMEKVLCYRNLKRIIKIIYEEEIKKKYLGKKFYITKLYYKKRIEIKYETKLRKELERFLTLVCRDCWNY